MSGWTQDQIDAESRAYTAARSSWTFDARIADVFEQHAQRSIPQLTQMRELVSALVYGHYERSTAIDADEYVIIDVGCSRGAMLDSLMSHALVLDDNTSAYGSRREKMLLHRSVAHGVRSIDAYSVRPSPRPVVLAGTRVDGYATEAEARAAAARSGHDAQPGVIRIDQSQYAELVARTIAQQRQTRVLPWQYIGVDASQSMIDRATAIDTSHDPRWLPWFECDDATTWPGRTATPPPSSCVLFVLSLMFMYHDADDVYAARLRLLQHVHATMLDRSMIVIVEKVQQSGHLIEDVYHDFKRRNGYSEREIAAKAASIDGVLVPLTARQNTKLLHDAGFVSVDTFYQWGPFVGWIAYKQ